MDMAMLRHQLLANNIANANTVGHVPMRLSFEDALGAVRRELQTQGSTTMATLNAVEARVVPRLDEHGLPASVHLDSEVAEMAKNSVHFQALTKAVSRHLSVMAMAANDGRK